MTALTETPRLVYRGPAADAETLAVADAHALRVALADGYRLTRVPDAAAAPVADAEAPDTDAPAGDADARPAKRARGKQ